MSNEIKYHLFGIVDSNSEQMGGIEFPVQLVQFNQLSAILYPASFTQEEMADKNKLVCLLKTYQHTLESLRTIKTVLPAQLSTLAFNQFDIVQMLNEYYNPLTFLLAKLVGKAEFEVQVSWTNIQQVLKQIAQSQEFIASMQTRCGIQNGNGVHVEDQIYVGKLLADAIEMKRKIITQEVIAILGPHASNFKTLPITDESLASHISFLIDSNKEDFFFEQLEKFSKICEFSELLKFKLVGPLVPYNFATISINYLTGSEIEDYRSLLNLPNDLLSEKDLKKQMRGLALTCHPDKDKTQEEIFKKMMHGYKLFSSLLEKEPNKIIELAQYKDRYVLTIPSISQELVSV